MRCLIPEKKDFPGEKQGQMRKHFSKERQKDIFPAIKWPEIGGASEPRILGSKWGFEVRHPLDYPPLFDIRSAKNGCNTRRTII